MRGLDGSHGVMIPVQNVNNLQLSDEHRMAQKFVTIGKNMVDINKIEQKYQYQITKLEERIKELSQNKIRRKSK